MFWSQAPAAGEYSHPTDADKQISSMPCRRVIYGVLWYTGRAIHRAYAGAKLPEMSPRLLSTTVLSFCLLLGACETITVPSAEETVVPESTVSTEEVVVDSIAAATEEEVPTPPTATLDDMDLMELGTDDIRHLFGEPDQVRPEEKAELWLYRRANCSVHIVYYTDQEVLVYREDSVYVLGGQDQDHLKVRHIETRAIEGGSPLDETACLQSLILDLPGRDSAG